MRASYGLCYWRTYELNRTPLISILEKLQENGVDYAQAYWIDKPLPMSELLDSESVS